MKRSVLVVILFLFVRVSFSQSQGIANQFLVNCMDSLLNLSYIEKSMQNFQQKEAVLPVLSPEDYNQRISAIPSTVPLFYDEIVLKYINLFAVEKFKASSAMLGLLDFHKAYLETALKKQNLPLELKYLPMALSGMFPRAFTSIGSSGIWQLSYPIAKRYNVEVSSFTDDRKNIEKSTDCAVLYLKELFEIYHDWSLALLAYTSGPNNLNKAMTRSGSEKDIKKISEYLVPENREILQAFSAVVYFSNFYSLYGISPVKIMMPASDTVKVKEKLHFSQLASYLKTPVKIVRDMNPEFRIEVIHEFDHRNFFHIPSELKVAFLSHQDTIYKHLDSIYFPQSGIYVQKKSVADNTTNNDNSEEGKNKIYHKIKAGESLGIISAKYKTTPSKIKAWNNMTSNYLIAGRSLVIYTNVQVVEKKTVNHVYDTKISSLQAGEFFEYSIKSGDNLWTIGQRYGVSVEEIRSWNNLNSNSRLNIGQILKIKKK